MPVLTKRVIDRAAPGERDWFLWDEELRGFGMKITPIGTKTSIVQYRADRRSRRFTVGRYGTLTPDEGRREARKILGEVAKGGDPQGEKATTRTAPVVNELLDR